MFRRKIYQEMLEWKRSACGKSALLIEGARRIGKSTVSELFAQQEYEDYLLLDFARESREIQRNFENIGDLTTFFRNLFLLKGHALSAKNGGRCAILFDEVQLFPQARQAIKYLVADGRYDYIETGSLISIRKNIKGILIPSEETCLKMYPMDFEEFLWAQGDDFTMDCLRDAFAQRNPLGADIHRKVMNTFRTYLAVGGMPQAVAAFAEGKTYEEIDFVKRNILDLYAEDLEKYDTENQERASVIFRTIPEQLENKNAHFRFSKIDKNARYKSYIDAVDFVAQSMIGNVCIGVTEPDVALELYADRSSFKLYMGDTGLLVTQLMRNGSSTGEDLYKALIFGKLSINEGMLMENAVAQMLRAAGHSLYFHEYYYQPKDSEGEKKYEIDFLTVRKRKICPIEVKSGGYRSHKSFDYLVEKYQLKMEDRFILYTKDICVAEGVTYLPLYMAGLL